MIAKILVPVRGDGKGDNVLAHAAALARRSNAHIAVTHCRARAEDLLPFGVPIPGFLRAQMLDNAKTLANEVEENLREELKVLCGTLGLTLVDGPERRETPTVSWTEEQGKQVDVIVNHGRLADIICVAKPDRDANLGTNTLKAALFNTGVPVMMCPPAARAPEVLGRKVAIAWNGSNEASRAVALSTRLMEEAEEVTILTCGPDRHPALSPEALQEFLSLRGVEAKINRFTASGNVGDALLGRAHDLGADLLVMGAYGDSHERETLFGGNTQAVVDHATMPVVLVH